VDGGGRDLAAANRLLALLMLVYVLHMLDRQIVAILLEPIRREFALSDGKLGLFSGFSYALAATVAGVPAGLLADRHARKRVLCAALTLWSGFSALCGAASGFTSLVIARMGVGAAEAGGPPAALTMIDDAFPPERRASAIGRFYAAGGLGTILSFTAGAWIAVHWGWRATFLATAVPGLLVAAIVMLFLREPARHAPRRQTGGRSARRCGRSPAGPRHRCYSAECSRPSSAPRRWAAGAPRS
jgi:MFS family permease